MIRAIEPFMRSSNDLDQTADLLVLDAGSHAFDLWDMNALALYEGAFGVQFRDESLEGETQPGSNYSRITSSLWAVARNVERVAGRLSPYLANWLFRLGENLLRHR